MGGKVGLQGGLLGRAGLDQQGAGGGQVGVQSGHGGGMARIVQMIGADQGYGMVTLGGAPQIALGKGCQIGGGLQGGALFGGQGVDQVAARRAFGRSHLCQQDNRANPLQNPHRAPSGSAAGCHGAGRPASAKAPNFWQPGC